MEPPDDPRFSIDPATKEATGASSLPEEQVAGSGETGSPGLHTRKVGQKISARPELVEGRNLAALVL